MKDFRDEWIKLQQSHLLRTVLLGILYSLLATAVLVLVLRAIRFLFRRFRATVHGWRQSMPSLRIQQYELLSAARIINLIILAGKVFTAALVLVILYFYASLVLGFFPWTRGYAQALLGYVLSALGLVLSTIAGYLPNLFIILIIVVATFYLVRFTRVIFAEIGKGNITLSGFHPEWAEPTYKIARFLLLIAAAIVVFPYLPGSKSPAFRGISIFLGVLFSLGSTSAVANIVAGVILTYMRAFRLGDRVQIADTVGDVIETSLLVTRIRTIKNVEITIANSMVLNSHIINFSGSVQEGGDGLILHTTVTIGYDAPWRQIHQLLTEAALATPGIVTQPAPFVLQTALDDFYVHYQINAYTSQPSRMQQTYSELHQNIQDKFYQAGVEIMSPHYSTIRDGNRIAIPDDYLPRGYQPQGFRVNLGSQPNRDPAGPTRE